MKLYAVVRCLILLIAACSVSVRAGAEQVVVKLALAAAAETALGFGSQRVAERFRNADLAHDLGLDRTYLVEAPNAAELAYELSLLPEVEYAQPVGKCRIALTPNDAYYPYQWALNNTGQNGGEPDADIDAPEAWDTTTGGLSLTVAIIDTGVDVDHPDLAAKLIPGWDFVNRDTNPDDDHGHGTSCAGIVGAIANNAIHVAGIAWGCRLMPLKVMGADGWGPDALVGDALIWAADHGAKVASLSLVLDDESQYVRDATAYAIGSGVTVVAGMGNDGSSVTRYPAGYADVIAVGASDRRDRRADFSNYGTHIAVVAPGVEISTTARDNSFTHHFAGTSAATPQVAGICALMISREPSLTPADLLRLTKQSADDKGAHLWDEYYGGGRANARRALLAIYDSTPPAGVTVTDDGDTTPYCDRLHASWTGSDAESGMEYFEYCIGSFPGSADARYWISAGHATQVTAAGLNLAPGQLYYVGLCAMNGAGLYVERWTNGIRTAGAAGIGHVKARPDGAPVTLSDKTVTGVLSDCFYVEDSDRVSGIRIVSSAFVQEGTRVNVVGSLTTTNGERTVQASSVQAL